MTDAGEAKSKPGAPPTGAAQSQTPPPDPQRPLEPALAEKIIVTGSDGAGALDLVRSAFASLVAGGHGYPASARFEFKSGHDRSLQAAYHAQFTATPVAGAAPPLERFAFVASQYLDTERPEPAPAARPVRGAARRPSVRPVLEYRAEIIALAAHHVLGPVAIADDGTAYPEPILRELRAATGLVLCWPLVAPQTTVDDWRLMALGARIADDPALSRLKRIVVAFTGYELAAAASGAAASRRLLAKPFVLAQLVLAVQRQTAVHKMLRRLIAGRRDQLDVNCIPVSSAGIHNPTGAINFDLETMQPIVAAGPVAGLSGPEAEARYRASVLPLFSGDALATCCQTNQRSGYAVPASLVLKIIDTPQLMDKLRQDVRAGLDM